MFEVNVGIDRLSMLSILSSGCDGCCQWIGVGWCVKWDGVCWWFCLDECSQSGELDMFWKWKQVSQSKCLNGHLRNTKLLVGGDVAKDGLSMIKAYPLGIYGLRAWGDTILVWNVASGYTVDVQSLLQSLSWEILLAVSVKEILERLWSMLNSYIVRWYR